jgi:hypothetical protein
MATSLQAIGTSEGAKKGWDTRGRGRTTSVPQSHTLEEFLHNSAKVFGPNNYWSKLAEKGHAGNQSKFTPEEQKYLNNLKSGVGQCKLGFCIQNAQKLASLAEHNNDLKYIEGLVTVHGLPIDHAWIEYKGKVFDPTLNKPDGTPKDPTGSGKDPGHEYFGIEVPKDLIWPSQLRTEHYMFISHSRDPKEQEAVWGQLLTKSLEASGEVSYPDDHKAAMRVPKGGSSCASCKYLEGTNKCNNEYFIKWNGSKDLPFPADEYCSDWYEPGEKDLHAGGPGSGRHKEIFEHALSEYVTYWKGPELFKLLDNAKKNNSDPVSNFMRSKIEEAQKSMGKGKPFVKLYRAEIPGRKSKLDRPYVSYSYKRSGAKSAVENLILSGEAVKNADAPIKVTEHKIATDRIMLSYKQFSGRDFEEDAGFYEDAWRNEFEVIVAKEPLKIKAAQETSHEAGALWNGIHIIGFTGPEEEGLRAMLSRVPPELLSNVQVIKSAKELNAKHGKYDPTTKTISYNPDNFTLKQKFGKGEGSISHPELTVVHEIGHSIYNSLTPDQKQEWENLSGWMKGWKPGQSLAYQEKRPGWGDAVSEWTHKAGVKFTRTYAERNADEDFADSFAFVMLNHGFQMEPAKKEFIDKYITANVKKYPQVSIQSPIRANKKTPNLYNNITAGGPGSGRHKEVEHEKPLSDRAQRALATYVPQSKEGRRISTLNELLVAKAVGGDHFGGTKPFDVIKGKIGIEVKTMLPIIPSKENRLNMKQSSIANKWAEVKKLGLKKVVTVGIDMRNNKYVVYVKEGLAGFQLGSMTKVGSLSGLKRFI